jgi:subtilisin family serine protease
MLSGRRGSVAPAICPGCTLVVRPIFAETTDLPLEMPSASPDELAVALADCVAAGANVINLSLAVGAPSLKREAALEAALDQATRRGIIVVAAAGNQGTIGSSAITRHPCVIPVVASDAGGRPLGECNLSRSIGRNGLSAPGDRITSLGAAGEPLTFGGTSAAAPFVTGAAALLWSEFPSASAAAVKYALLRGSAARRTSIVPPLLDAWAAYHALARMQHARRVS